MAGEKIFLFLFVFLLITFVSAQLETGFEDSSDIKVSLKKPDPPINTTTGSQTFNQSDIWVTNEGLMDNVPDLYPTLDLRYLELDGSNANQDIDIGVYNFSTIGYFSGQPLDGSIGSGIINASSLKNHCGCVNASDKGGLDVWYPDTKVRIWDFSSNEIKYCNIAEDTYTIPDDVHTVYYIDSGCNVQTMTWANYFAQDMNPPNYARLFDVYALGGDIEIVKGASVLGLTIKKSKFGTVNCGAGHLGICDGMAISESPTFPELNMTSGHMKYINSVHTIQVRDSNPDGIHIVCESDGSHTAETEIDIDKCDNGASCDACPDNKYRRYIIYNIGWGDHTEIHQLAPLDDDTYTTLANCIDTSKNPLSYTLPSAEDGVANILAFYCGKRDDTAWSNGLVDLRLGKEGFGASPDLSEFVTYNDWSGNVNANDKNLTNLDYLQATTLNVTGNVKIYGNLNVTGNITIAGYTVIDAKDSTCEPYLVHCKTKCSNKSGGMYVNFTGCN